MTEYLVEVYVPRESARKLEPSVSAVERAAEELRREGRAVRYLRSILVPDDETCFLLYEATSAEDACEAATRAGLRCDRVTPAIQGRDAGQGAERTS